MQIWAVYLTVFERPRYGRQENRGEFVINGIVIVD